MYFILVLPGVHEKLLESSSGELRDIFKLMTCHTNTNTYLSIVKVRLLMFVEVTL